MIQGTTSSGSTPGVDKLSALPDRRRSLFKQAIGRSLRRLGYRLVPVVTPTDLVSPRIPGWFSPDEAEALYLLAAASSAKRMLEIGHFVGRSTSAICEAIRDSGAIVEFNSYDLGLTTGAEFVAHYRNVYETTSTDVPPEFEALVFSQHKTTTEVAQAHLQRFGLDRYVNLITGDFTLVEPSQYQLIFCDATHDLREISIILPHVMNASSDDCIWAFHDMNPANVAAVVQQSPAWLIRVVDTLGIFRFRR